MNVLYSELINDFLYADAAKLNTGAVCDTFIAVPHHALPIQAGIPRRNFRPFARPLRKGYFLPHQIIFGLS